VRVPDIFSLEEVGKLISAEGGGVVDIEPLKWPDDDLLSRVVFQSRADFA
jgi:hypothetical protein